MAKETNEEETAEATGGKKLVPMALAVVIGIAVGGLGGAFVAGPLLANRAEPETEAHAAVAESGDHGSEESGGEHGEATAGPAVHTLRDVVLNPANSGGTRFLMATLAFSVTDSAVVADMASRDAEVRDAVLRVLGRKTVLQLADIDTRPLLKEELQVAIDSLMGGPTVDEVYFPQFVIQ